MCFSVPPFLLSLSNLPVFQGSDDRDLRLSGHVGFDSLPDQLVNKCVNKGFDFNVLCIGNVCVCACVCVCVCERERERRRIKREKREREKREREKREREREGRERERRERERDGGFQLTVATRRFSRPQARRLALPDVVPTIQPESLSAAVCGD